jgi:hypothetical protein
MAWYDPSTWIDFNNPATKDAFQTAGPMLSFFGTINSAVGTYYQTQAKASALQHQAEMAEINARISERSAQSAMLAGQKQIGQLGLKAGKLKSAQKVSLAANGVVVGSGSAAEILASTDLLKEIDANQIWQNTVQKAWSIRTQGTNQYVSSLTAKAAADSLSPFGAAGGTLLSGVGDVATNWYALNKDRWAIT